MATRTETTCSRPGACAVVLLAALLAAAGLVPGARAAAQENAGPTAASSPLAIESIRVEPRDPGADTLCKLWVTLANHGDRIASQLAFRVSLNGVDLPVYAKQLYLFPLPAGKSTELRLYNFWSTETGRAMPADGKLNVRVTLTEAQWMDHREEKDEDVWKPLGAVPGLPVAESVTLAMKR